MFPSTSRHVNLDTEMASLDTEGERMRLTFLTILLFLQPIQLISQPELPTALKEYQCFELVTHKNVSEKNRYSIKFYKDCSSSVAEMEIGGKTQQAIGVGTFAVVFPLKDNEGKNRLALKVNFDPTKDGDTRLALDAQKQVLQDLAVDSLEHSLSRRDSSGKIQQASFFIMERMGKSLSSVNKKDLTDRQDMIRDHLSQIQNKLKKFERTGVLVNGCSQPVFLKDGHGGNILLDTKGESLKAVDFDIARSREEAIRANLRQALFQKKIYQNIQSEGQIGQEGGITEDELKSFQAGYCQKWQGDLSTFNTFGLLFEHSNLDSILDLDEQGQFIRPRTSSEISTAATVLSPCSSPFAGAVKSSASHVCPRVLNEVVVHEVAGCKWDNDSDDESDDD